MCKKSLRRILHTYKRTTLYAHAGNPDPLCTCLVTGPIIKAAICHASHYPSSRRPSSKFSKHPTLRLSASSKWRAVLPRTSLGRRPRHIPTRCVFLYPRSFDPGLRPLLASRVDTGLEPGCFFSNLGNHAPLFGLGRPRTVWNEYLIP